ncbi:DUF2267 domain-containing protein [Pedomonas sp. V897]|uniref:DUF2267 domain-containing protein n=1 Tax=Pedomonas sp. V897 TaxID=3446482 RepID=UPI003EE3D92E
MSTTGLDVFDKTLQTTHIWLKDIGEVIGPDRQRCYHALRAVLTTLRDRLPVAQAVHLGAELPLLVRGIYYDGFRPAGAPLPLRSQEAFLAIVAERFGPIGPANPRASTIAVFRMLRRRLPAPMIAKIKASLPQNIRALFDGEPETAPAAAHKDRGKTAADRRADGEHRLRDWGSPGTAAEHAPRIRPEKLS